MIRRSTAIATAAVLLSLLLHMLGLGLTVSLPPDPPESGTHADSVAMGTRFEDMAETLAEPVQPDPAPTPEPPVETPPEPVPDEPPTSDAQVASDNPQQVFAPDTGPAQAVTPDSAAPAPPDPGIEAAPQVVPPAGGTPAPAPQGPETDPPAGAPEAAPAPAPAETATAASPAAPSPAPQPPVAAAPAPADTVVAVLPPADEALAPVPDAADSAEADAESSDLAVAVSPRPRPRQAQPAQDAPGLPEGTDTPGGSDLAPSQMVESPLTVYRRDGTDLLAGETRDSPSRGRGFDLSRGPGNADSTNYAGLVLVHLNRSPAVRVSQHGFARVFFQINPDGSLAWVDIIDGSGSPAVDRAAKAQVRGAAPFPPPPGGTSRQLTFVYQIN